jgi:DNA polymerase V
MTKMLFYPFKGSKTISEIYSYKKRLNIANHLNLSSVSAGFPSPADDYIDLNQHLIQHPPATFFP